MGHFGPPEEAVESILRVRTESKRVTVDFATDEGLRELCGERDSHLRWLEARLGITVVARGTALHLSGDADGVGLARDVLDNMARELDRGGTVDGSMMRRLVERRPNGGGRTSANAAARSLASDNGNGQRHSEVLGRTEGQRRYVRAIDGNDVVFGVGPAGTGKTYIAVACGVEALRRHEVRRIVLTRPAVEAGERLGFLPGDLAAKVNPYLRPLFDALTELMDAEGVDRMVERQEIEIAPLAFMRGRTLSNAYVILDEAQNCTVEQMAMLLTRLGPDSKCIVTGDMSQSDLPRGQRPGLSHAIELLQDIEGIEVVHFDVSDVVRHPLVARIAAAYSEDASRRRG